MMRARRESSRWRKRICNICTLPLCPVSSRFGKRLEHNPFLVYQPQPICWCYWAGERMVLEVKLPKPDSKRGLGNDIRRNVWSTNKFPRTFHRPRVNQKPGSNQSSLMPHHSGFCFSNMQVRHILTGIKTNLLFLEIISPWHNRMLTFSVALVIDPTPHQFSLWTNVNNAFGGGWNNEQCVFGQDRNSDCSKHLTSRSHRTWRFQHVRHWSACSRLWTIDHLVEMVHIWHLHRPEAPSSTSKQTTDPTPDSVTSHNSQSPLLLLSPHQTSCVADQTASHHHHGHRLQPECQSQIPGGYPPHVSRTACSSWVCRWKNCAGRPESWLVHFQSNEINDTPDDWQWLSGYWSTVSGRPFGS